MNIRKILTGIFFLTFFIGTLTYVLFVKTENKIWQKEFSESFSQESFQPKAISDTKEEEVEREEDYDAKFETKMLLTGVFWSDEVRAKSGETWLGLFKKGNNYSLLPTEIRVKRTSKYVNKKGEGIDEKGKDISVTGKDQPLFLLQKADFLESGKVVNINEQAAKKNEGEYKFDYKFNLSSGTYKLFAKNNSGENKYNGVSKLALSDGKIEQIIYSQKKCDDCSWDLIWSGDLDDDGKLDLFLNLSNHYNVRQLRLFLSSEAEKDNLVKEIANFRSVGC